MQIYYMKKKKIPIPVSTVVLMIVTITYKLVLVVIGIGILIFGQGFLHRYLEGIFAGLLSGTGAECILRNVYDDFGLSSSACQSNSYKGDASSGKTAFDETEKRTSGKAGSIYGYIPGKQRYIFKRTPGCDPDCIWDYICSENGLYLQQPGLYIWRLGFREHLSGLLFFCRQSSLFR